MRSGRSRPRGSTPAALALALALLAPACGNAALAQADRSFLERMVPHHQQAVDMSESIRTRTDTQQVRWLAERISTDQAYEIESMLRRLDEVGRERALSGHGRDDAAMPGMQTPQQLAELDAAPPGQQDQLFLTMMIEHHEGGMRMADEILRDGADPEIRRLAEHLVTVHGLELEQLRTLRDDLGA